MRLFKRKKKENSEQYSKQDLISFGNYLLSNERTEMFALHPEESLKQHIQMRLQQVHSSDLHNWQDKKDKLQNKDIPVVHIDFTKYVDDRI
jgi:hypothetical protein